jgi:hypothetical protein
MTDYGLVDWGSVSDISRCFLLCHCSTSNDNNSDKAEIAIALYLGSGAYPSYYLVATWNRGTGE